MPSGIPNLCTVYNIGSKISIYVLHTLHIFYVLANSDVQYLMSSLLIYSIKKLHVINYHCILRTRFFFHSKDEFQKG